MPSLSDRVILITGASGNLGRAVVRKLDAEGARLALPDRRSGRLGKVFGDLEHLERHSIFDQIDVMDADEVQSMLAQVVDHHGHLDGWVHTIGGYKGDEPTQQTPLELWDRMHDLNVRSAFVIARAVIPHMLQQERGKIVTIGARPGLRGMAKASAYSASKSALIRLTESLSAEVKHQDINVNCIVPGTIDTPENRDSFPKAKFERWVQPGDIANVIAFLLTDAARAIHGATIPVYGIG